MLIVVSHIDRLRPPREWQPPYDLLNPRDSKAVHIPARRWRRWRGFGGFRWRPSFPSVWLKIGIYNVDDVLWAAMLDQQDEAIKARFLRCLDQRIREENWVLLRRQLANAGRWILKLPGGR